jgi:hypothetical protein
MPSFNHLAFVTLVAAALAATGCTTSEGPDVLAIDAGRYDQAFNAALEVTGDLHMPAVMRDRRGGLIETDAAIAPSLIEPWAFQGDSFERLASQTVSLQRRRTRFEFIPAGFTEPIEPPADELAGPDLLELRERPRDLTTLDEPLELRVWVYIEQATKPGIRYDTWSRRNTTRTVIIEDGERVPGTYWTRILQQVATRLDAAATEAAADDPDMPAADTGDG